VFVHGIEYGVTRNGVSPGHCLENYASKRINVGTIVQTFAHALLRTHVQRTAEHIAGLGELLAFAAFFRHDFGDTEID
jgi:hypothetical protein